MGSEKRFAINMIAQVIAFLVNVGIGLLLTPYIVKSIGKEAYGFVGLANNFISYAQIVVLALNSMAARFVTICVNRGEYVQASKYFSSVFYSNLFLSIILFVFSLVVVVNLECLINIPVEMSNDVKMLFALIFLNFILSVFFSVYSIATFTRNRLDLASIRNITSNFFRVFVLLVTFCFFFAKSLVSRFCYISCNYLYCNYKYNIE
ncbi:lipopolysaccharide biosynthesis protein [Bacteroides fragilis]